MKKIIALSLTLLMLGGAYADSKPVVKAHVKSNVTCTMEDCPYADTPACCCK